MKNFSTPLFVNSSFFIPNSSLKSMKSFFLPLLTAAALLTAASSAHAQDKPALNTAPPGSRPAPVPQPQQLPTQPQPAPAPTPQPAARPDSTFAPAPTPPPAPTNLPRPTQDNPSGLNFPGRPGHTEGYGGPALTAKKMFVYTNFGLDFGSSSVLTQFNISAAPAIGYRVTDRFAVGPGISYAYSSYSLDKNSNYVFPNGEKSVSASSVGLKAFAQFIVYKEFFLHGEYEVTKAEIVNDNYEKIKKTVSTPLLGVGYRTEFSSNAAVDFVVLYNFNDGISSGLYGQPVIRLGFLFNIGR